MTADTVGGVWTYSMELAAALEPHGIEVLLATMGGIPSPEQRKQVEARPNVRLFASAFKLEWMKDPWDDVRRAGRWLLDLESRWTPDLIHLNNFAHGHLAWRAPVLMVGHSCVLSWWRAVHRSPAPEEWNFYGEQVRRGLQAAGLVAAPTRNMLAALECHYGPLPHAKVIPNARRLGRFAPGPAKEPFVLAAGRLWDEAKNIAALTSIAARLPWPVYLAGATHGASEPAGSRVHYLGSQSEAELAALMSRTSIYALPARYEPFGLSILEAALSGCALLLGDIPSLRENWDGAALFVDPDDTRQLLQTLLELTRSPADLKARSLAALSRAARFTTAAMAASYLEAYRHLMSVTVEA